MQFGADIEFFLQNKDTGKVVPVCGKVGGSKGAPIAIDTIYSCLEDGAALELNYSPTTNAGTFVDRIWHSPKIIEKFMGLGVYTGAEATFDDLSQFPQANQIGCAEDFWAYGEIPDRPRPIPEIKDFGNMRFAGGHIHLGYVTCNEIPRWVVARLFDAYITVPLMWYMFREYPKGSVVKLFGENRRKFYGLPGLYRPKDYGIEYRSFSNYIATDSPLLRMLRMYLDEFDHLLQRENLDKLNDIYLSTDWELVKNAISNLDYAATTACMQKYKKAV